MEHIICDVPDRYSLVLYGDMHVGSTAFAEWAFDHLVSLGRKKNTYFFNTGDLCEARAIDHPYFEIDTAAARLERPLNQYKYAINKLKPLASRHVAIGEGNHDYALWRYGKFVQDFVCEQLDVPYAGYMSRVEFSTGLVGHFWHGSGMCPLRAHAKDPIQREGNKKARLVQILKDLPLSENVHFQCMGHTHELLVQEPLARTIMYWNPDTQRAETTHIIDHVSVHPDHMFQIVPQQACWYMNTGAMCQWHQMGTTSYAEQRGYQPNEVGYLVLTVNGSVIEHVDMVWPRQDKPAKTMRITPPTVDTEYR